VCFLGVLFFSDAVRLPVLPDGHHLSGDEHHEIEEIVALLTVQVRAASRNLEGAAVYPVKDDRVRRRIVEDQRGGESRRRPDWISHISA
jgi:hypothetical protein